MTKYELFIPPEHLAEKDRRNWNRKEAEEYKEWLLNVIDERTSNLLNCFNEHENTDVQELLTQLGRKVADKLKDSDYSEDTGNRRKLTNRGYALAADMGLLIAKFVLRDFGEKISWTIKRKAKSEMSYNLPVLEIKGLDYFDPIGVSIANATSIINDNKKHDAWLILYKYINDSIY